MKIACSGVARRIVLGIIVFVAAALRPPLALAAWAPGGVPVATVDNDQRAPAIVRDGAGGAIIAWWDDRPNGTGIGIYAQRLDADGNPLWTTNGILVGAVEWVTVDPVAVSDGLGGAYIVWSDSRSGQPDDHLYAQRVGADGSFLWAAGGVQVCPDGGRQYYPQAISDFRPQVGLNTNGFIIVFYDTRVGAFTPYAQRMDMNGTRIWGNGGVRVGTTSAELYPSVDTDGTASPFFSAGALVTWKTGIGIRANWINANGIVQWGNDGLYVCNAFGDQANPVISCIGPRRGIVAWEDFRDLDPNEVDVFAQKVDNGAVSWTFDGIPVGDAPGPQFEPHLAAAADGAFVVWRDGRDPKEPLNHDIYVQRLDQNGNPAWTANGIPICTTAGFQTSPRVTVDGAGGIYVVWVDGSDDDYDLQGQRLNAGGNPLWNPQGVVVSEAPGDQDLPELLLNGDHVLLVWEDTRNGGNEIDIYASRLTSAGTVAIEDVAPESAPGIAPNQLVVRLLSPNPQRGEARFAAELTEAGPVNTEVCDVSGRRLRSLRDVAPAPGSHVLRWDGRDANGRAVPSGVYFLRVTSGPRSSVLKLVQAR